MPSNEGSGLFKAAAERYALHGVDVETAIRGAGAVPISIHCWQGDDVGGFERSGASLSGGGIQTTGNYPGKARSVAELRSDLDAVLRLVPGARRLSLHAIYGEFNGKTVDRDALEPSHFAGWMDWAKGRDLPLDFNATLFSHPLAADGYTLSHPDPKVRAFWIEHVKRSRKVAAAMGAAQGSASVHNTWIPDGAKDCPYDRAGYRARLLDSLDAIFADRLPATSIEDSVEGKLFGIGSEAFVVGSHEFYLGYAATHRCFVTLDMGHYHPTESVADKISSILPFVPGLLIHVSRGVRWDSDHVVIVNDELLDLAREMNRSGQTERIRLGLDYFDASLNRVGAWAIGARSTRKALLIARLEPRAAQLAAEAAQDGFSRLALLEEEKTLPWAAVWDECCRREGVPTDAELVAAVKGYERQVLSKRSGASA
jgi:L-rhamnose isomerase